MAVAARSGSGNEAADRDAPREHHAWCQRAWRALDPAGSGCIPADCLGTCEFRAAVEAGLGEAEICSGSAAGVEKILSLVRRKADMNADHALNFEEFSALTLALRSGLHDTASLVFALFDLDCDGRINEADFLDMFGFFLGRSPTDRELQAEWLRLDIAGSGKPNTADFFAWLESSPHPVFSGPVPAVASACRAEPAGPSEGSSRSRTRGGRSCRTPWNQRFASQKSGNRELPPSRRSYLSRPQSLPELRCHYEKFRGFQTQHTRLLDAPAPRPIRVLSTETANSFAFNPSLDKPGGTMRSKTLGKVVPWRDHWQTPLCVWKPPDPASLLLRCPGQPPPWMFAGPSEVI